MCEFWGSAAEETLQVKTVVLDGKWTENIQNIHLVFIVVQISELDIYVNSLILKKMS